MDDREKAGRARAVAIVVAIAFWSWAVVGTAQETTNDDLVIQVPPPAVGDEKPLELNAALMGSLLEESALESAKQRKLAGAMALTAAGILLALGPYRLLSAQPADVFSRGLVLYYMTFGALNLTTGIFALTQTSHEEHIRKEWKKAAADGVTREELINFEGQLQAAQYIRRKERLFVRWNSLAGAIASAFVFTVVPIKYDRGQWSTVMAISGAALVVGMVTFGTTYQPLPAEHAWSEYQAKKSPFGSGQRVTLRVTPTHVSREGFAMGFTLKY